MVKLFPRMVKVESGDYVRCCLRWRGMLTTKRVPNLEAMKEPEAAMDAVRTTLSDFLRARRSQCQPEQVGLRREPGRRVNGLRRDEVAFLAGVSGEYYMRLEQGRVATPSMQVLAGLARSLCLDAAASEYLYRLAGHGAPRSIALLERSQHEIDEILRWWPSIPVYITDANLDIVAANDMMAAVTQDDFIPGKNVLIQTFAAAGRDKLDSWEGLARKAIALFRYTADEESPRYAEIVRLLLKDADFLRLWELHEVSLPAPAQVEAKVDGLGELRVSVRNFSLPELHGYLVTLYDAAPGSVTEKVFQQIADHLRVAV